MPPVGSSQRNPYKGAPLRAWVRLRFQSADGSLQELELVADTGNLFAVILSVAEMGRLLRRGGPGTQTNFGPLIGGWLELAMPELGLATDVLGFAGDAVDQAVQASHPDFQGLAGLPLLGMVEYGGDAGTFWLQKPNPAPAA
jgi:hypothetical protein